MHETRSYDGTHSFGVYNCTTECMGASDRNSLPIRASKPGMRAFPPVSTIELHKVSRMSGEHKEMDCTVNVNKQRL
jgi:hypothetical protein